MPEHKIPEVLSAAEWDRNKGTIAKMGGETGIGKALSDLAVTWGRMDWSIEDPRTFDVHDTKGIGDLSILGVKTDDFLLQAKKLIEELKVVQRLAASTEIKWKGKTLIPKASIDYVGKVEKAAAQELKELERAEDVKLKLNGAIDRELKLHLRELAGDAQDVENKAGLTKLHQKFGLMYGALQNSHNERLKHWGGMLTDLEHLLSDPAIKTDEEAKKHLPKIELELQSLLIH